MKNFLLAMRALENGQTVAIDEIEYGMDENHKIGAVFIAPEKNLVDT